MRYNYIRNDCVQICMYLYLIRLIFKEEVAHHVCDCVLTFFSLNVSVSCKLAVVSKCTRINN